MFKIGKVYNRRSDIHKLYKGQQQGGISTPANHKVILIFTGDSGGKYGYQDSFRPDGTYWYTGEGQTGDMAFTGGNLAIRDHKKNGKRIYLFDKVSTGHVQFIGEAAYLGHHIEQRSDKNNQLRNAIVFELEVDNASGLEVKSEMDVKECHDLMSKAWSLSLEKLKELAQKKASSKLTAQTRKMLTYLRSEAIKIYVLKRSKGLCEACGKKAPFITKKGKPYLEPHHIRRVADGGPDDPLWVAAVCPNCHKEVHQGRDGHVINIKLSKKLEIIEKIA